MMMMMMIKEIMIHVTAKIPEMEGFYRILLLKLSSEPSQSKNNLQKVSRQSFIILGIIFYPKLFSKRT